MPGTPENLPPSWSQSDALCLSQEEPQQILLGSHVNVSVSKAAYAVSHR